MRFSAAILATMLAAVPAADAAPRIAVVRVADVYKQLESTRREQEETREKRQALLQDRRLAELNKMIADIEAQRQRLASLDASGRGPVERELAVKLQEARTLEEEVAGFRSTRNREINAELVAKMQASLERIRETALKLGKEEGFDWVLDTSGNTNTGLPLILYAKDPVDLTDRVAATLGVAAPKDE